MDIINKYFLTMMTVCSVISTQVLSSEQREPLDTWPLKLKHKTWDILPLELKHEIWNSTSHKMAAQIWNNCIQDGKLVDPQLHKQISSVLMKHKTFKPRTRESLDRFLSEKFLKDNPIQNLDLSKLEKKDLEGLNLSRTCRHLN